MRLHEHEAAAVFNEKGIPIPRQIVAESTEEALKAAGEIEYPVMLKAQILAGGRGLCGGIQTAATPGELETYSAKLLGSRIKGLPVRKILVSEKIEFSRELYIGITVDGFAGRPVIMVGMQGGVNIEALAQTAPDKIASFEVEPEFGFHPYQSRLLLGKLGFSRQLLVRCADVVVRLYEVFTELNALIAEINPLVITPGGKPVAVDAVLEVDDSALTRIRYPLPDNLERIENSLERKAKKIGVTYIDLDGDIGIISSGAGLAMASMDIVGQRLKPANFLETGGGITENLLYQCMELLMMKKSLRGVLINIYGGINPIHEGARGVVRYLSENNVKIPIVAKALGNHQEETWEIFESGGVHVVTEAATEAAVDRLFELVSEQG